MHSLYFYNLQSDQSEYFWLLQKYIREEASKLFFEKIRVKFLLGSKYNQKELVETSLTKQYSQMKDQILIILLKQIFQV